jgi:hypothetical protein
MSVALSIPNRLEYIGGPYASESVGVEDVTVRPPAAAGGWPDIKASGQAVPSAPGSGDDDIDGCEVEVEVPTSDEDLPPAEGGVA